jgi:hypothetical protein
MKVAVAALTILVLTAGPLAAQSGTEAPVTDARIDEAIAKACATLKQYQRPDDGSWDDFPQYPGATTALAVQALLLAGEPPDSPVIQKAIIALAKTKIEKTYAVSCRAMAYSLLVNRYPELRPRLAADVSWFVRNQLGNGMWPYGSEERAKNGRGDNSLTQFAVIGLRDASLAGIEVPESVWVRLLKHYQTSQNLDGGWSYIPIPKEPVKPKDPKNPPPVVDPKEVVSGVTVTAPSLASLMIVQDELAKTGGCPCADGRSSGSRVQEKYVDAGIKWLADYFDGKIRGGESESGQWQCYFYYGLQRAGQASGLKTFGKHDWYARGVSAMLGRAGTPCLAPYYERPAAAGAKDKKDGERDPWIITVTEGKTEKKMMVSSGGIVDVSLAVIFLVKGNAPTYMNKLKYDGDWNRHRRDLALVTQEVAKRLERPFRWQVVDVKSAPKMWKKDSPLIYISGEEELKLTDEEKKNLKDFCRLGGTLFVESNCGNKAFTAKFRELCKELWPECPLQPLQQTHSIYDCQLKIATEGLLEGVDDGIRTFCFFTEQDFSCAWQNRTVAEAKDKFDLAINLYTYATDKAPPPSRLGDVEKRLADRKAEIEAWKKAVAEERDLAKKEKRAVKRIPAPGRKSDQDLEVDLAEAKCGKRTLLTVGLLKHEGNYRMGLQYEILSQVVEQFQKKIGVTLAMGEAQDAGSIMPGTPDVLLVRGDQAMKLTEEQRKNLISYMTGGGFVIAEAGMGRKGFDEDFRKFIADSKVLSLEPLTAESPLLTGQIDDGIEGIEVTSCRYSRTLREENPGVTLPTILAIKAGGKIVGYYSPYDLVYSSTGYIAYGIRGYDKNSALALLINMFLKPTK